MRKKLNDIAKDTRKLAQVATIIIFLALIRCISEPFRLQYFSSSALSFADIKPFLLGALVTAIALLVMTVLFYLDKYKMINAVCILIIAVLLIIKQLYLP